jgi:hypothetical protein
MLVSFLQEEKAPNPIDVSELALDKSMLVMPVVENANGPIDLRLWVGFQSSVVRDLHLLGLSLPLHKSLLLYLHPNALSPMNSSF